MGSGGSTLLLDVRIRRDERLRNVPQSGEERFDLCTAPPYVSE